MKTHAAVAAVLIALCTPVSFAQAPAAAHDAHPSAVAVSTEISADVWSELLAGNDRFIAGAPALKDLVARRKALATEQHPRAIILTCSDSRVSPELLFDTSLGDIFVIRTAGNVADDVAVGSIEYAIEHLHVHTLIVLGHSRCGAVAAALSGDAMPTKGLEAIVHLIAPAVTHLTLAGPDSACEAIAANVHQSAADLVHNSPVVAHAAEDLELRIIEATYDLASGAVTTLR